MALSDFFKYGEKVAGYDVRVLNEREARAAAGILFIGAFIGLTNGVMLGTAKFSQYFVTFFMIDFIIRVIQPRYSPSLLLGRMFVRNQKPEYVGAIQKRFAWAIGAMIAIPMFWYLVIDFQPNPLKVLVCLICMFLLFFESAFSICFGCKLYNLFSKEQSKYCPGGVCELNVKEDVQKFTKVQSIILILTILAAIYGTYAYFTKLPDRTIFTQKIKSLFMSKEEKLKLEKQKELEALKKAEDEFDRDDEF